MADECLSITWKAWCMKEIIDKLALIKIKHIFSESHC